jgi:hypothetical protein
MVVVVVVVVLLLEAMREAHQQVLAGRLKLPFLDSNLMRREESKLDVLRKRELTYARRG